LATSKKIRPTPRARSDRAPAGGNDLSLTEQAYSQLEEMIVTLKLAPGRLVTEAELSELLGIGRTPIREALQRLAAQRLVRVVPRRGIAISDIDVKAQLRLLEVRRELERLMCRNAARRASTEERAELGQLAAAFKECAKTGDAEKFMRIDRAFNELCLVAARNEFTTSAMSLMNSLSRRFWFLHYRQAADLPLTARLHAALAHAIAIGDEEAAAQACDKLLDTIHQFTRATVSTDF